MQTLQTKTPTNNRLTKRDILQVSAFKSFFNCRKALHGNVDLAFAEAIAMSSDDSFEEARAARPDRINEYMELLETKEQP